MIKRSKKRLFGKKQSVSIEIRIRYPNLFFTELYFFNTPNAWGVVCHFIQEGENFFNFELSKLGKWWNNKNEIDIVGLNTETQDILFGECKYWKEDKKADIDVLHALMDKAKFVEWGKNRREHYIIFSKSGFTDRLLETTKKRENIYLV